MLLEELRAHLPDQRTLFSGETMEQAVSSLWPRRAGCEVRRVRSKAVGTLLGGSAAVAIVVSLSAAFASCLSVACMSGMVVPAVLALLWGVGSSISLANRLVPKRLQGLFVGSRKEMMSVL